MITPVSAVSTRRHLRSAGLVDLVIPKTRTVGFGLRTFLAAGMCAVGIGKFLRNILCTASVHVRMLRSINQSINQRV